MDDPARSQRVDRVLDVMIHDADDLPLLVHPSKTVNLSVSGLLMYVPLRLDVLAGADVVVKLRWEGGLYVSSGRVVRFESPYKGDAARSVMGVQLHRPVPAELMEIPSVQSAHRAA